MNRPLSRFLPAFAASASFWLVLAAAVVSLAGCAGTAGEDVSACVKGCAPYPAVAPPVGWRFGGDLCRCLYIQGGR